MATDKEKYETFKRMDMPLLANHYAKKMEKESGSGPSSVRVSGGGGKGGRPDIDPNTNEGAEALAMAQAQFNNDGKFGYYNNEGRYVGFLEDATDGGGMNTTDTFFAGGPLSNMLNIAKIRPAGLSREKDENDEFKVHIKDIGYRDATDMGDGGGPQHEGGPYMGGGKVSMMGNLLDSLSGRDQGKRKRYDKYAALLKVMGGG